MILRETVGLRRIWGLEEAAWEEMERGWGGGGVAAVEAVYLILEMEVEVV